MQSTQPKRSTFWRLLGFLKPLSLVYFASMIGLALVLTSERLFIAWVIKLFIDSITNTNLDQLWYSVKIWFVFLLGYIPLSVLFSYLWRSTTVRVVTNLRQNIFGHIQRLPLAYHEQRHSADLMSVMTNDITATEQAFQKDMLDLIHYSLQGILAAVFMLVLNWQLALLIVGVGMIPLIINTTFARPLRKAGDAIQGQLGVVSERLADLLAGFQVVRTFSLGEWILARFTHANRDLLRESLRRVQLDALLNGANTFGALTFTLPMGYGAYLVLNGQTTFGILIALIQLNNPIQMFVFSVGGTISRIQASLAAADRILEVLDAEVEPAQYGDLGLPPPTPAHPEALLEFRDVSFQYADGKAVLNGMSFAVRRGQSAAFVGPSGGGKSTILKLLLGCYPVRQGAVFVAGKSLNAYPLEDLREQFAYIPQDAYLYSGTILDNIRYGRPDATQEDVIQAAQAAYAHEFISAFPQGYDTLVGERGARLSGGQRQRIAIARALLKDAPILLLDEATSALDSEAEEVVQRALGVLMRGRTVLVIAHRLSTIENADLIFVVDGGTVVEAGRQEDLLAQKGLFYRLHELQFHDEDELPLPSEATPAD